MSETVLSNQVLFESGAYKVSLTVNDKVFSPTSFARSFASVLERFLPKSRNVCELGVGTGVLSIIAGLSGAKCVGLDHNLDAIHLARENWRQNNLPNTQMDFRESDLFSGLHDTDKRSFDLVWSNPPCFPTSLVQRSPFCHRDTGTKFQCRLVEMFWMQ